MTIIIRTKLTPTDALLTARDIEQWFKENPKRQDCVTDGGFVVQRGEVAMELIKHTALPKDAL